MKLLKIPKNFERRLNKKLSHYGYYKPTKYGARKKLKVTTFPEGAIGGILAGKAFIELPFSILEGTESELLHFVAVLLLKDAGLYSDLHELADSLKGEKK